jgi:restriction endonuclease S subunit
LSKIDARNGAFGVVPEELDNAIITGNFWTFDVDYSKINPHYLNLVTSSKHFHEFCQSASVGTTNRNYLQEKLFLDVTIPLPTIEIQNKIVNNFYNLLANSENRRKKIITLNNEIEKYLECELGIEIIKRESTKGLNFSRFKDLTRWDIQFLLNDTAVQNKFPTVKLNYIINSFMRGEEGNSIRFESYKKPDQSFIYLGMEQIEKGTGDVSDFKHVKGSEIKSQTLIVPKDYFIYGKLRPYLNKYWLNETDFDNLICSSEFFVFAIKNEINKEYFKYILGSQIIQNQITDNTTGARMPRINEDVFLSLKIPIPPKGIQSKIVQHINKIKSEIKKLKKESEDNIIIAKEEIERELFS